MNNAFFVGNPDIIRLLLNCKADIDYINSRGWTSVSFLWEPDRPAYSTTGEILDICISQDFSIWSETDTEGWTPCHRAAAYGRGEDVVNLHYKGGNIRSYTTNFLWGPITCAVWHENDSTFDALLDLLRPDEIREIKDSRGWTLLHMAAQRGRKHMLSRLLDVGADTGILTMGTEHLLSKNLEYKRLTAHTIAQAYGYGGLWDDIIASRARPIQ